MAASGDAADLVARAGAGVACEPGNPASIAEAIRTFVAMSAADREAMGRRGQMFYKKELSFAVGVDSMEAALRRAAEAG
jgi:glycosyltransferase involved in cell wall biosynthesis